MTEHRKSYLKTAVVTALIAVAGLAAILWIVAEKLIPLKPWTPANLVWWIGGIVLLCAEGVIVLVLGGALVVLHRDRLEMRGEPYGLKPREWHGGFLVNCLRSILRGLGGQRPGQLDLHAGDLVEVRSREEILATLDERGELESLPFMPEMEALYGRQARVHRRVDKIFDWITETGLRRMKDTVILEGLRCDGADHGGCQADCPILWKEAWLRRASTKQAAQAKQASSATTPLDLRKFTTRLDEPTGETRFVCQLCKMPAATTQTRWNDPVNLLRELCSGNVRLAPFFAFVGIWMFNAVQRRVGGILFPIVAHSDMQKTPHAVLDLQVGELVRIKSKREIEQTLNAQYKNRGLFFDKEMSRFCGGTFKVRARVDHQIEERNGKMVNFTTPCITLEDVTATGEYFEFAPLDERIYWREIWLERVK